MSFKHLSHKKGLTAEDRFWKQVRKTKGCWLWLGALSGGYGHIRRVKNPVPIGAHRFSWELHKGNIPGGKLVLHSCDNPRCVNPGHVFLGSHADNKADAISKDRHARKGSHGMRKLTEKEALSIRRRYLPGVNQLQPGNGLRLAEEFGITRGQVIKIAKGLAWKEGKL